MSSFKASKHRRHWVNYIDQALLKRCFIQAYNRLHEQKQMVNELNVFPVPDGDTGTNMSLTMKSAIMQIEKAEDDYEKIAKALGNGSLMGARGNSGVILSQLCRGAAAVIKNCERLGVREIKDLLKEAKEQAYKAVMKPTEGTILTVARYMAEYAQEHYEQYDQVEDFLMDVLGYGNMALSKTKDMLPALKEANVVDAGGQGLIELFIGFLGELTGKNTENVLDNANKIDYSAPAEDAKYKLTFSIGHHLLADDFLAYGKLTEMGEEEDLFHYEIYTDFAKAVVDYLITFSDLSSLHLTHLQSMPYEGEEDLDTYGFVSVSLGEGFDQIFKDLMVNEIVSGGQTMNPSTKDIYDAVEKVKAENVFVFPNNKNILMSANQVQELTEKNVIVIPTKSIPQAFSALFHFDENLDVKENRKAMEAAISYVKTGQITYAIRDTEVEGKKIEKGDYLGILDGKITKNKKDREELLFELIEDSIDGDISLLTVYAGKDIDKKEYAKTCQLIEKKYPQLDCAFEVGGQPTYFYIFSLE